MLEFNAEFYDSEHIAVCMFQDENWQNIEIQILELVKEHLLNEHDEKQESKENLDMKALKSESSEKNRENKVFKQSYFDRSYRQWMIHHKHTLHKGLSWLCANL